MSAEHHDEGKPPLADVPRSLLLAVAHVLKRSQDSGKYPRYNWREGAEYTRFASSALRHLMAWLDGQDMDHESGLPHLWHAATNIAFLVEWEDRRIGTDDRYGKEKSNAS